jgi:single-stranded-DNA-specific exonuclease
MKNWVVQGQYDASVGVLPVLLRNRGVGVNDQEEFLTPRPIAHYLNGLSGEFKAALKQARQEILRAINQNSPIIIHGDYDADGICATAILYKTLTQTLGYAKVAYFIPNRFDHGYGLSLESVTEMAKLVAARFKVAEERSIPTPTSPALIITVDCGITAEPEVLARAHDQGFRLIITDHHQKQEHLPQAEVVLWTDGVVGAGVALILSLVLGAKDEQLVSLAGIATVTDLAPLRGFNRALVTRALASLATNPPLGISSLLTASGRTSSAISTYDLGYIIGPRLNAAGRLESAYASLNLLLEEDSAVVLELAQKLTAVNTERQELTLHMLELAGQLVNPEAASVVVVASPDFHEGVIGLVAGKLAQKYYRPAIVISVTGDTAKGSARSVPGVNISDLLRHFEDRFTGLGGHPMAAGFSLHKDKLDQFMAEFVAYTQEVIPAELLVPQLTVDLAIPLAVVTEQFVQEVDQLRPYGVGNPEPLFVSRAVGVAGANYVGKDGAHLSVKLFDGSTTYKSIMFDAKNLGVPALTWGSKIDLVYSASLKDYNGKTSVDLIIKDYAVSAQT